VGGVMTRAQINEHFIPSPIFRRQGRIVDQNIYSRREKKKQEHGLMRCVVLVPAVVTVVCTVCTALRVPPPRVRSTRLSLSPSSSHHAVKAPFSNEISNIGVDLSQLLAKALARSTNPTVVLLLQTWQAAVPPALREVARSLSLGDLLVFALFQLSYKRTLRWAHKVQIVGWKVLSMGGVEAFSKSILGFFEERAGLLSRLMGCNYAVKICCLLLGKLGFSMRADLPLLISKVLYAMYITHFVDLFKTKFMHVFFPALTENRRSAYVFARSSSVVVWSVGVLVACEMVSTFMKVPLTSTLAFGGVGGLVLGFSARDIAANFLGGMLLLFNEPFTPGDMVTMSVGKTDLIGRVERVGWGQTRIRGRDTRPTYIPNSHFVQTAVTNMERITHRKMETTFPIRYQDAGAMMDVLSRIKDGIRTVPKLDALSMPFRVSFVRVGSYGLEIEVVCYFATKSIDEFLALQQMANLEILRALSSSGAKLALPTTHIYHNVLASDGNAGTAATTTTASAAAAATVAATSTLPAPPANAVAATASLPLPQVGAATYGASVPISGGAIFAAVPPPSVASTGPGAAASTSAVNKLAATPPAPMKVVLDGHEAGDLYTETAAADAARPGEPTAGGPARPVAAAAAAVAVAATAAPPTTPAVAVSVGKEKEKDKGTVTAAAAAVAAVVEPLDWDLDTALKGTAILGHNMGPSVAGGGVWGGLDVAPAKRDAAATIVTPAPALPPAPSSAPVASSSSQSQASVATAPAPTTYSGLQVYEVQGHSIDDVDDPVAEVDNTFFTEGHSIDDVDDVDSKWIEMDTTFGEW